MFLMLCRVCRQGSPTGARNGPRQLPPGELCPTGDLVFQASWGVATSFLASLSPVHLPHEAAVAVGTCTQSSHWDPTATLQVTQTPLWGHRWTSQQKRATCSVSPLPPDVTVLVGPRSSLVMITWAIVHCPPSVLCPAFPPNVTAAVLPHVCQCFQAQF